VEACFGPFGLSANLDARYLHLDLVLIILDAPDATTR
jgi:N-dimethylarginine dimethylaminohydrolase